MNRSIDDACGYAIDFEESMVTPVIRYLDCYALTVAVIIFIASWLCWGGQMGLPMMIILALFVFQVYRPAMGLATSASIMRVMEVGLDRYEK
jgi:hypothetical protein